MIKKVDPCQIRVTIESGMVRLVRRQILKGKITFWWIWEGIIQFLLTSTGCCLERESIRRGNENLIAHSPQQPRGKSELFAFVPIDVKNTVQYSTTRTTKQNPPTCRWPPNYDTINLIWQERHQDLRLYSVLFYRFERVWYQNRRLFWSETWYLLLLRKANCSTETKIRTTTRSFVCNCGTIQVFLYWSQNPITQASTMLSRPPIQVNPQIVLFTVVLTATCGYGKLGGLLLSIFVVSVVV